MPLSNQEQAVLDQEFESQLDDYMTEWEKSLREKWLPKNDSPVTHGGQGSGNFGHLGQGNGQVGGSGRGTSSATVVVDGVSLDIRTQSEAPSREDDLNEAYLNTRAKDLISICDEIISNAVTNGQTFMDRASYSKDELAIVIPSNYKIIEKSDNDNEVGRNYRNTRVVALYLQQELMKSELNSRGILHNATDEQVSAVTSTIWEGWIQSSQSPQGLLFQQAVSEELGGHLQKFTDRQMRDIRNAAKSLSEDVGSYIPVQTYYTNWQGDTVFYKYPVAEVKNWDRSLYKDRLEVGLEIAKAHVAATWGATQYVMEKAGVDQFPLYRGLVLDASRLENERVVEIKSSHDKKDTNDTSPDITYQRLPDVSLLRNGASSSAANKVGCDVANNWNGVGNTTPSDGERIVLRIDAPRTSYVSIPAYGKNKHHENEVVLAGTKWNHWEAYLNKAPYVEDIPYVNH